MNITLITILARVEKDPIFFTMAACALGLFFFINGLFLIKKKRMIENMPTSHIKSVAVGFVEIFGKVKKYKEFLVSQWKEDPCIYYDLHIERREGSGKNRRWVTVKRDTKFIPFYLEDDTGKILVDLTDADFKLRRDHVIENGTFSRLSPRMKEFLEKHKVSYKSIIGTQMRMKISEDYIGFGESLYVLGSAEINDKYKNDEKPDKDKLLIGKNKAHPYFFVSDSKESELLKDFGKSVPLKIFGGAFLSLTGLIVTLFIWSSRGYFLFK